MKRKMIGVLLTIVMICSMTVKADQVEIRRTKIRVEFALFCWIYLILRLI